MILNDIRIRELCNKRKMIEPFAEGIKRPGIISYGVSSFGYDMRIGNQFKIFTPSSGYLTCIDPKNFDERAYVDFTGDVCVIPPNSFILGRSVEYFAIPRNIMCLCLGKSTYARCGLIANFTPFEPGWCGHVTIEISNTTPLPAMVYANEGIAQVLFFEGDHPEVSYADKQGKYQAQANITTPKVDA